MPLSRFRAAEAAVAILASAPSLLGRIAPYVGGEGGREIDWASVAELARQPVWSDADRAFLRICAEIAGQPVTAGGDDEGFGTRWNRLGGQRQALVASVLFDSAQLTKAAEAQALQRLGIATSETPPTSTRAVRVRLGPDQPAMVGDALGRERVGFREGASIHETWLRGRGVWRLQADRVVSSPWLLIAHAGIVRLVGTIQGVNIHGDRLSILGEPLGDHPLIGRPDPLDNASQNPIAYGEIGLSVGA